MVQELEGGVDCREDSVGSSCDFLILEGGTNGFLPDFVEDFSCVFVVSDLETDFCGCSSSSSSIINFDPAAMAYLEIQKKDTKTNSIDKTFCCSVPICTKCWSNSNTSPSSNSKIFTLR